MTTTEKLMALAMAILLGFIFYSQVMKPLITGINDKTARAIATGKGADRR